MCLHCSDMFKFARELKTFLIWHDKLAEEFFA
jgi:hypothetical protein